RELLLLGEGNFSFSTALCLAAGDGARITATSYHPEDATLQQDGAAENIQQLRDSGVEVFFEVDCTRLTDYEALAQRQFDCIIFNFPHCGRKAGVKKNRSLLAKFFLSCAQVLRETGEVHVALCNGQGGTPADQPIREWHNSWQAVAMAAEAGFILSEICPFDNASFRGYRSTGYRSQDKSFHVEGALTHIFTRSLPCTSSQSVHMEAQLGRESICFEVPEELNDCINRNFLGKHSRHPVHILQELLLRDLRSPWPMQRSESPLPELFRNSPGLLQDCGPDGSPSKVFWIRPTETRTEGEEGRDSQAADISANDGPQDGTTKGYGLRPSLLLHAREISQCLDFSPGILHVLSGTVFQRVLVSKTTSPAFHQLLLVGAFRSDAQPCQLLQRCLEAALAAAERVAPNGAAVGQPVSFKRELGGSEPQLLVSFRGLPKVGQIGVLPAQGGPSPDLRVYTATLNLDLLACQVFSIPDWRLLWSRDPRFQAHFLHEELRPFCSFSLYPPAYSHDVSFWVEPESFDELDFHALVRQVSGGTVREVALVDRFRHPHMGHASLCYRLTYQACDRALSYSQALGMQLQLRKLLPQRLQVTLR
ncbi:FDXA1 protein, partial [Amia calva]|nr:FDXA1 protein [Amia calva]